MTDNHLPDAVMICHSTTAIPLVVTYCRRQSYQVTIRCGGHNWNSCWFQSKDDASELRYLLLDVGDDAMRDMEFDETTQLVSIGPGVTSQSLLDYLGTFQKFVSVDHCPTVAMGGFLFGGGYGIGMHRCGLACYQIQEVEVVLGNGEIVTSCLQTKISKKLPSPEEEEENRQQLPTTSDLILQLVLRIILWLSWNHHQVCVTRTGHTAGCMVGTLDLALVRISVGDCFCHGLTVEG